MIKIERKLTDKAQKAIMSLQKARDRGSSYNTPEVYAALQEMFHGKCYICENKISTSYQIEHLHPHREQPDLKYDWNNLYLACAHCNKSKQAKYDPIIDCAKENVEASIAFRKKGYFGTEEKLLFEPINSRKETINTQLLLQKVHYGSTFQEKVEAKILRRTLRKELSAFKEYVREYQEAEDMEKEDLACLIKQQLGDSSSFAAFKRWLIRDHKEVYPELFAYIDT